MDDRERDKRFRKERSAQLKRAVAIRRDTAKEVVRLLNVARDRIKAELAGTPSAFQAWYLPKLQASVSQSLRDLGESAAARVATGAGESWQAGVDYVDRPIAAGGVRIEAALPAVDTRQLLAMRTFMTDRIKDVSITVANRINSELGLVAIGAQAPSDAISAIDRLVAGGRGRAITIVRTELGRVFSTATQERLEQASKSLPGLKKQWRRSGKIHSRPEHDAADGQVRDVGEPFLVGGIALMYPRDPAGPPSATINCGCEALPFMEHWQVSEPGPRGLSEEERATSPGKRLLGDILDTSPRRAAAIDAIERMPAPAARREIRDWIAGGGLRAFLAGARPASGGRSMAGDAPVATLADDLGGAIGAKVLTVRLSRAQAEKQLARHPDLAIEDYARLQRLIDKGEAIRESDRHLVLQRLERGQWWRAVVKATARRDELFAVTLHRIRPKQRERVRKSGTVIREAE